MNILTDLEDIYATIKRVRRELHPTDRLAQDLDIDSLASVELLLAIEEKFDVNLFNDPRASRATTVGDLAALLTPSLTE